MFLYSIAFRTVLLSFLEIPSQLLLRVCVNSKIALRCFCMDTHNSECLYHFQLVLLIKVK